MLPSKTSDLTTNTPRAPEPAVVGLADRVGRFIEDVHGLVRFGRHRDLAWVIENARESEAGPPMSEKDAARVRRRIASEGQVLAGDVRRAGMDPRTIRTVVHIAEPDGVGLLELVRRWE